MFNLNQILMKKVEIIYEESQTRVRCLNGDKLVKEDKFEGDVPKRLRFFLQFFPVGDSSKSGK